MEWPGSYLPGPSFQICCDAWLLAAGGEVTFVDLGPVDSVPPGCEVVGPTVLVFQVVRMLPDVDAEDRDPTAVHKWTVLVRGAGHGQIAIAADDHPCPTAAKATDTGLIDRVFERVETAEGGIRGRSELAGRLTTAAWAHDLPEHRVVDVAAAVVADRGPLVFRHPVKALYQFLGAHCLELGVAGNGVIDVGHVRAVMLVMVNLHRLRIDMRLQRRVVIWKRRKLECHRSQSLLVVFELTFLRP
jgi:hypothetical protein